MRLPLNNVLLFIISKNAGINNFFPSFDKESPPFTGSKWMDFMFFSSAIVTTNLSTHGLKGSIVSNTKAGWSYCSMCKNTNMRIKSSCYCSSFHDGVQHSISVIEQGIKLVLCRLSRTFFKRQIVDHAPAHHGPVKLFPSALQ